MIDTLNSPAGSGARCLEPKGVDSRRTPRRLRREKCESEFMLKTKSQLTVGLALLLVTLVAEAQSTSKRQVLVPMRDGVQLAADLYLPPGQGPFPVLLQRTPYDRSRIERQALPYAEHGYAVVVVNSRGIYGSGGTWSPYVTEAEDGYDTQKWVAAQAWCSGNIGMFGTSYPGFTQLLPAPMRHPAVKALVPVAAQSDNYGSIWSTNGLYHLALGMAWGANQEAIASGQARPEVNWMGVFTHFPLRTALSSHGLVSPFVEETLAHGVYDDFWRGMSVRGAYHEMDVPALHITGWYDDLVHETVENFVQMRKQSRSEHARRWQRLLIGPWGHGIRPRAQYGDVDFGETVHVDTQELHLSWFDYHLKGIQNGLESEAPIRIFVMGENVWRAEQEWPLRRARLTRLFLRSGGNANTRFGDGTLASDPPESEEPDRYRYDPRNPTPTYGGSGCCGGGTTPHGPLDQQVNQSRQDVLTYTTEPLSEATEVTGAIKFDLYFSTDVKDTDFFATISDVYPDGTAVLLAEGMLRARFRESIEEPSLLIPGGIYRVSISFWETSNLFRRGHRIRLHITSSNFPRFARNLNSARPLGAGDERDIRIATQVIYHDSLHPSSVVLPVIPRM